MGTRSADAYRTVGDKRGQAHAFNNKAMAEVQNGDYAVARNDLEQALLMSQFLKDDENQVQSLNNLWSAYYFHGSYSQSQQRYAQAEQIIGANQSAPWSNYWLKITQVNQATLLLKLGRSDQALNIYKQVEATAPSLTNSDRTHILAMLASFTGVSVIHTRLSIPIVMLRGFMRESTMLTERLPCSKTSALLMLSI